MKYAYRIDVQGFGTTTYLKFQFDRQIGEGSAYHSSSCFSEFSPKTKSILRAVNQIKGVNKGREGVFGSGGLVEVNGSELVVQIAGADTSAFPKIADRIVKTVQRRIAPNESRQRVKCSTIQKEVDRLNAKA